MTDIQIINYTISKVNIEIITLLSNNDDILVLQNVWSM